MAISKQRLEELIQQGATIYFIYNGHIDMKEGKYKNDFILSAENVSIYWSTRSHFIAYKNIFETKEDAEEYAEFGNITRTERLELNSYETFLKSNTGTMFYLNACEHLLHKVRHSADDENPDWRIEVCVFYNDLEESSEVLYSKPLTRENYNEARRLCVKLFKGEDV